MSGDPGARIHPMFRIAAKFGNHHPGFTEYAGSDDGHAQGSIKL